MSGKRRSVSLAVSGLLMLLLARDAMAALAAVADIPALSSLRASLDSAGLMPALSNASSTYTLLAPSNDAIADALSALNLDLAAAPNPDVLLYHLLPLPVPLGPASTDRADVPTFK
ncbi:hypothetical protein TSOC_012229 [Tetrabaena socialis]|uniref:FAS1 domain-containing protein n=1 Tax=Tetrabaena socialis TaxID=47790 RepID=A0A2J7ZNL5_9CHLO|nr:hypothetical protein TSOC_012229 [Tetrabaena socialis]|eukprot:PNH01857.1 hypothetical protein TSOC_012229 [Tetrabaena socialis]